MAATTALRPCKGMPTWFTDEQLLAGRWGVKRGDHTPHCVVVDQASKVRYDEFVSNV